MAITMTLDQAYDLAARCQREGRIPEADNICARILEALPTHEPTLLLRAGVTHQMGRYEEAAELLGRAIAANPKAASYHSNLGVVLADLERPEDALGSLERAIELNPNLAEAYNNIGNVCLAMGRGDEAIASYRRCLAIRPDYVPAMNNLSGVLNHTGELDEAIEQCNAVLAKAPDYTPAMLNLARAYKEAGRLDEALELYRASDAKKPDPRTLSDLLFTMHFHPDYGPCRILEEHLRWNERYAAPHRPLRHPHDNDPAPARRLRVGYVAYDVGDNALGRFLLPLLASHDHANFEVYCYSDIRRVDDIGHELTRHADVWRPMRNQPHDQIVQMIREDRIDVLVDIAMHSHGNRLAAFACKPAPVQITYLAYCSTTGVETMDYRITDPYLDPAGRDESVYAEKLLRLPRSWWCYPPPPWAPEPAPVPALANGRVTFGCLNDFAKVNEGVLALWRRILREMPDARLIIHSKKGAHRQPLLDGFAGAGVDPSRIEFVGFLPSREYYETYNRIDVALDPFPWAGGITTCDALWMGVPVVSCAGETAVSRGGLSLLTNVGLPELATDNADDYVATSLKLARDLPKLQRLRSTLRDRMRTSPIMDGKQFAADVESLYRRAWESWCASRPISDTHLPARG